MSRLCAVIVTAAILATSTSEGAAAQNQAKMDLTSASKLNCIYNLLRSDKGVKALNVYRVDGSRLAVEFTFLGSKDQLVSTDVMLRGVGDNMTVSLIVSAAGADSSDRSAAEKLNSLALSFMAPLNLYEKCTISSAFDDVLPFPRPRAEWQRIEWPSPPPG